MEIILVILNLLMSLFAFVFILKRHSSWSKCFLQCRFFFLNIFNSLKDFSVNEDWFALIHLHYFFFLISSRILSIDYSLRTVWSLELDDNLINMTFITWAKWLWIWMLTEMVTKEFSAVKIALCLVHKNSKTNEKSKKAIMIRNLHIVKEPQKYASTTLVN